ncbi:MAG: hypothetical protein J0H82_30320 [Alphaproteobacteria bacterium]|nr:hypothetical protein [Alphaproteobacteria bacterium]
MSDRNLRTVAKAIFTCIITEAEDAGGEIVVSAQATFQVEAWDPESAAQRAVELWDQGEHGDKSDVTAEPLFIEVRTDGSDSPLGRYRASSIINRFYTTTEVEIDEYWPKATAGGAA